MGIGAYSRLGANFRLGTYSNKYGTLLSMHAVLTFGVVDEIL